MVKVGSSVTEVLNDLQTGKSWVEMPPFKLYGVRIQQIFICLKAYESVFFGRAFLMGTKGLVLSLLKEEASLTFGEFQAKIFT